VFDTWSAWRDHGALPYPGGFLSQPLKLMMQIEAVDFVYHTWRCKNNKDFKWSNFTATQRELIVQVEGWLNEQQTS